MIELHFYLEDKPMYVKDAILIPNKGDCIKYSTNNGTDDIIGIVNEIIWRLDKDEYGKQRIDVFTYKLLDGK